MGNVHPTVSEIVEEKLKNKGGLFFLVKENKFAL
jgi:hypothetical protein